MIVKKLVVLDLDQTLIHSVETRNSMKMESFTVSFVNRNEKYFVHKRSYLNKFINELRRLISDDFKVAIWTAARKGYAIQIMDKIWPTWRSEILFLRSFQHCSANANGDVIKDMSKLNHKFDILLIDDNPLHFTFNTANKFSVWKIKPFMYTSVDSELLDVLEYIKYTIQQNIRFSIRPKTPTKLHRAR